MEYILEIIMKVILTQSLIIGGTFCQYVSDRSLINHARRYRKQYTQLFITSKTRLKTRVGSVICVKQTTCTLYFSQDTIQYTTFTCTQKLTNSQLNPPHGTKKRVTKKLKTKTENLRRNNPVTKSVQSVLRPERSLWWERSVKEIGLEPQ